MKVIFARESGVTLHLILFTSAHYFDEHPEFRESMEKVGKDGEVKSRSPLITPLDSSSFISMIERKEWWITSVSIPRISPLFTS